MKYYLFPYIMINVYYSCQNCINRKHNTCVNTQTNRVSLVSLYLTSSLIKDGQGFLTMDMSCHLIMGSHHQENDVMDKTHPLAQHNDRLVLLLLLSSCQIRIPSTKRLCNSRIPEEYLVCYKMSQHNWGDYKDALQVSPKVFVGLAQIEIRICHSEYRKCISGPSR